MLHSSFVMHHHIPFQLHIVSKQWRINKKMMCINHSNETKVSSIFITFPGFCFSIFILVRIPRFHSALIFHTQPTGDTEYFMNFMVLKLLRTFFSFHFKWRITETRIVTLAIKWIGLKKREREKEIKTESYTYKKDELYYRQKPSIRNTES